MTVQHTKENKEMVKASSISLGDNGSSAVATTARSTQTTAPVKKRMYGFQPRYAVNLKPEHGGRVLVNAALVKKPEYADILFGELTGLQELWIHLQPLKVWALCWASILLFISGCIPKWLMCAAILLCCIRSLGCAHDSTHAKTRMPFPVRMTGFGLFCSGFMPFAAAFGDIEFEHVHRHHRTKGPLDPSEHDRDSRWSRLPLWKMALLFFFYPSHSAAWEIVTQQYMKNPAHLWPERIALNFCHWSQLAFLYHLGGASTFLTVLSTGHVAMFLAWGILHGLLHSPIWYKFITQVDPSGLRKLHPCVEIIGTHLLHCIWLEIKWHDVHHTHGHALQSFMGATLRGYSFDEIDVACANLVDEGLFIDQNGGGISPLASIGHKIGSRKEYLAKLKEERR